MTAHESFRDTLAAGGSLLKGGPLFNRERAEKVMQQESLAGLSVDCPAMNTGIGGSAHMEDLSLITLHGAEPIHTVTDPVIIV